MEVSIIIPVYNGEKFLQTCIDSCLNQDFDKEYEIIIVNDGSTDSTKALLDNVKDNKVKCYHVEHQGISYALNYAIKKSSGKYLVRMDSDDIMLPDRLTNQYEWMEKHPNVYIVGAPYEGFYNNSDDIVPYYIDNDYEVTFDEMLNGSPIAHPTICIRKSMFDEIGLMYESYYDGAEDFKLYLTGLSKGYHIWMMNKLAVRYRIHYGGYSQGNETKVSKHKIDQLYSKQTPEKDFTAIITFHNEGNEVEKTVQSIRATTKNIHILLVNDVSTDNYDYQWIADKYNCEYYVPEKNLGCGGARQYAVEHCKTKYFVILDGHMRFYNDDWDITFVNYLKEDSKQLLFANSIIMGKDDDGIVKNENAINGLGQYNSYGAYINFNEIGWEYSCKWAYFKSIDNDLEDKSKELMRCSTCLGACYVFDKDWWDYIGGTQGLLRYGYDESLLSIKTWLAGGTVNVIKDFGVGHLYRSAIPYTVGNDVFCANQIYLINLFEDTDKDIQRLEAKLKKRLGKQAFDDSYKLFEEHKEEFDKFKKYFNSIKVHDIKWFKELNELVVPDDMKHNGNKELIFNIGAHNGIDSEDFLQHNYKVVSVECNPNKINTLNELLNAYDDSVIIDRMISDNTKQQKFYISNMDVWSSTDISIANRNNIGYAEATCKTTTINKLIKKFGMPLYMKIDIEGSDIIVLNQLEKEKDLPKYISVESECIGDKYNEGDEFIMLNKLEELGYNKFRIIEQTDNETNTYPWKDIDYWYDKKDIKEFITRIRPRFVKKYKYNFWFDLFATKQ